MSRNIFRDGEKGEKKCKRRKKNVSGKQHST